ncbi:MAG TPA: uroporphyrinogen-III C-methyltransferase [Bryobacteraceae bacterium]|nr:uroporphyrinogen-III C-methyltransferase [Bryobacteraceae bacterium]
MAESKRGKLYLMGAGPGDAELLTLKAARILGQCDVVLYDRLVSRDVLSFARPDAELIYVGKHEGEQEHTQARIFELIRSHALNGKTVARLKGGDPLVFGRGAEEWRLAIDDGIEVELIPGITSAIAVPGLAGIPLTYRGVSQSFAVVTGHCHEGVSHDWARYTAIDTLVVLMGVTNRQHIARALIAAGRSPDQPVALIERGSMPEERVVEGTLGTVAAGRLEVESPAVFVIGEVVRLRAKLRATARESQPQVLEQLP